jgi:hypothetical protein
MLPPLLLLLSLLPPLLLLPPHSHGTTMEPFVSTSLVQLLCRTVKLAWFDSDAATSIVDDCKVCVVCLGVRLLLCVVLGVGVGGWVGESGQAGLGCDAATSIVDDCKV